MNYQNPHGPSCPWYSFAESQGSPNIKWCEETLCQWISEPANTWSNLGYLIVAVVMTYLAFKNKQRFELKQFGPIIFLMGAMSFYFHQSNYYTSQLLDFIGMFLFVGWVLGMNLIRLDVIKKNHLITFNLLSCALLVGVVHLMYKTGMKFQMTIIFYGVINLITEVLAHKKKAVDHKWLGVAVLFLGLAFSFSILDGKRIWCVPQNHGLFSQGHALWHWISAIAMFAIYKHYSQPKLDS